jgi:hypothetical protein
MNLIESQRIVCERYGSPFYESPNLYKVGVSANIKDNQYPISGLRHPLQNDTTGWYIWAGDYSSDSDFFVPLHVEHLKDWCPEILKFLGLAPGWRFLFTPEYQDVWEDVSLLDL